MSYMCDRCKSVCDEFDLAKKYDGEDFGWFSACPVCGCEFLTEVDQCEECDRWTDLEELDNGLCPMCKSDLFKDLRRRIREIYSPAQVRVLREYVDSEIL